VDQVTEGTWTAARANPAFFQSSELTPLWTRRRATGSTASTTRSSRIGRRSSYPPWRDSSLHFTKWSGFWGQGHRARTGSLRVPWRTTKAFLYGEIHQVTYKALTAHASREAFPSASSSPHVTGTRRPRSSPATATAEHRGHLPRAQARTRLPRLLGQVACRRTAHRPLRRARAHGPRPVVSRQAQWEGTGARPPRVPEARPRLRRHLTGRSALPAAPGHSRNLSRVP